MFIYTCPEQDSNLGLSRKFHDLRSGFVLLRPLSHHGWFYNFTLIESNFLCSFGTIMLCTDKYNHMPLKLCQTSFTPNKFAAQILSILLNFSTETGLVFLLFVTKIWSHKTRNIERNKKNWLLMMKLLFGNYRTMNNNRTPTLSCSSRPTKNKY